MDTDFKANYIIRNIKTDDYEKIPGVYASAFDETPWKKDWHCIPQFDSESVWVAAYGDFVAGFLISFFSEKYSVPYISVVATSSSNKRQGIGTTLVGRAFEYWKMKGFADILVHTDVFRSDALGLYNKCGFRETETAGDTVTLYRKL